MARAQTLGYTHQVLDWSAILWATIASGVASMMVEMILLPLFGMGSPWGPPRMMAAIILGQEVLPPPATFDLGVMMAAMLVHFMLSFVYVLILAFIVANLSTGLAIAVGAGFGLLLYWINFYGFTAVFPWFANARNWITILMHLIYGAVAAGVYKAALEKHHAAR